MQDGFEKDFGYLMPFIDRIAAAANSIADDAAREEFTRLVSDERARWMRIRQLLSGAEAQTGQSQQASEESKPQFQFTVGSLRKRES
ncbi:MAG: hypothetical protein AB1631_08080 [Acidobacteriota bacterium]